MQVWCKMGTGLKTIPRIREVHYGTYANLAALTSLLTGDLGYATDRAVLYRWNGSAWEAITISSRHGNVADIGDPTDYPESSLYQADDEGKLYMITASDAGAQWFPVATLPVATITTADSANLRHSYDAEKTIALSNYTMMKEIALLSPLNQVRVKFDLYSDTIGETVYGRIYKNKAAFGTEQSIVGEDPLIWTTFEEVLADLIAGDKLQVYAKKVGGAHVSVRNFRLYYDGTLTPIYEHANTY